MIGFGAIVKSIAKTLEAAGSAAVVGLRSIAGANRPRPCPIPITIEARRRPR